MSKNEPDNDFTTRTWFVGEAGDEEQAPEDTLIPGEQAAAASSGNDSLIAGDGLSAAPPALDKEELPSDQLSHTDSVIAGTDEKHDDLAAGKADEVAAEPVAKTPTPEVPATPDSEGENVTPQPLERKSLSERAVELEEDTTDTPQPETLTESEVESTADRRYSLLNSSEDIPESAAEEAPHWDSVEETEPEEVLTTAEREKSFEDTIFEGATVKPTVPSRAAAHIWSLLLFLVLVPLSWYLIFDVATRLSNRNEDMLLPASTLNVGQWVELVAAVIVVFLLILVARFSSLGAFVTGLALTVAGGFFMVNPSGTAHALKPLLTALDNAGQQGHFYQALPSNIAHHLAWSGGSGMLLFAGIALLGMGLLSHSARRAGRKDYLVERKVKAAEESDKNKED